MQFFHDPHLFIERQGREPDAAFGDPAGAPMLLGEAYIPYYWRCALAWVQAMIVVPIVGMGIGERAADRLLRTVPIWLSVVVGVSAVAMGLVP